MFIAFLDHDDVLRPHALFAIAEYLRTHADADVVYSDEDKLLPDGGLGAPAFKPDFSPDRLLGENYINHLTVMRRSLLSRRPADFVKASTGARITTSSYA